MTLHARLLRLEQPRTHAGRAVTIFLPARRQIVRSLPELEEAAQVPRLPSMTAADAAALQAAGATGVVVWRGSIAATLAGRRRP